MWGEGEEGGGRFQPDVRSGLHGVDQYPGSFVANETREKIVRNLTDEVDDHATICDVCVLRRLARWSDVQGGTADNGSLDFLVDSETWLWIESVSILRTENKKPKVIHKEVKGGPKINCNLKEYQSEFSGEPVRFLGNTSTEGFGEETLRMHT